MWMIRAGRSASFIDQFREQGIVAIGWQEMGELPERASKDQVALAAERAYPDSNRHQRSVLVGQVYRFLNEVQPGDKAVSYDPGQRVYLLGVIKPGLRYEEGRLPGLPRIRPVEWEHDVSRDLLSTGTKNSIGAISTLFRIPDAAATEILEVGTLGVQAAGPAEEEEDEESLFESTRDRSREFIKDRINRLDPYDLQDLVAGVLRAMGYKTRVSSPGSDRGVDIQASPDGFGFEQPRIVVECKHRPRTAMGSQEIRSFLGGRHKDDKGLFVSTGGFTKEARYEAERASIPLTLMDLDQLVDAVVEHYEQMDSECRVLLPLAKLYWPLD